MTVCTKEKQPFLCEIVGDGVLDVPSKTKMLAIGAIAEKYLRQMSAFYENVSVAKYVIMPNHIHFLIVVESGTSRTPSPTNKTDGTSRTPSPTKQNSVVSRFVSTFKRFCNKEIGENVWQRSFNDHIIRNQEDFDKHWQYIDENPLRWRLDELYLSP